MEIRPGDRYVRDDVIVEIDGLEYCTDHAMCVECDAVVASLKQWETGVISGSESVRLTFLTTLLGSVSTWITTRGARRISGWSRGSR